MAEYIEREEAIKVIMEHRRMTPVAKLEAELAICRIPAVDVAPVRRGRWVWSNYKYNWICSKCMEPVAYLNPKNPFLEPECLYCPACGAMMLLDEEEEKK